MLTVFVSVIGLLVMSAQTEGSCYQDCSASFNHKLQQLKGVTDTTILNERSCQAMEEQMACLERKKPLCDVTSLQHVYTILGFIRPDYARSCTDVPSTATSTHVTAGDQAVKDCDTKMAACQATFDKTPMPPISGTVKNWTIPCESLDDYTVCIEELIPQCGKFMSHVMGTIRSLQQQYTHVCSDISNPQAHAECVNDTLDCYEDFHAVFSPAWTEYILTDMCRAMDGYSRCLSRVHERGECHRFSQKALDGIQSLKTQNAVYCGDDGGVQAQLCVEKFQECYTDFNTTYFPAVHSANMDLVCTSVTRYWQCAQPMYELCGHQMARTLESVRLLKEQFAMQCDPEYQRLASCEPLLGCLRAFTDSYNTAPEASNDFCPSLKSYFPCVETSLEQCGIPPEDTSVDFSQLGSLIGSYCEHLLGNSELNECAEYKTCASGIILVSSPDPSAMFDASTWCSYMDMSLGCVQRAVDTTSCALSGSAAIIGHLQQQRDLKRDICKRAPVIPLVTQSPNTVPGSQTDGHGNSKDQTGSHAMMTRPTMISLVCLTVLSLALRIL